MRPTCTSTFLALALPLLFAGGSTALAGEIRGRLVLDDRPVAGASVSAVPWESPLEEARREARRAPAPAAIASAVSRPDGTFALAVPAAPSAPPHEFRVLVEGAGLVPSLLPGSFDGQETEDLGDLPVSSGAPLAGRVEAEGGGPAAGVEVFLTARRGTAPDADAPAQPTVTGADGTFRFDAASPDRNELVVRADGRFAAPLANLRAGAIAAPILLRRAGSISGVVRKADRQTPAGGALVRFEGQGKTRWVETAADGTFALKDVPAGTGSLVADGGEAGFAEIAGLRAAPEPVTANLAPGARLEGRVVSALTGKAVPRARVSAAGGRGWLQVRSGPDGRYQLRNVLPGRYTVKGDEPRHAPWEKPGVVLRAGEIRKLDLPLTPGVTISGTVTDEAGAPVGGARGSLAPATQTGVRALLRGVGQADDAAFVSAPNGTFRASRLKPGDNLRLTVHHAGFETGTLGGLNLPAGTVRSGLAVTLAKGLALSGTVRDGKREPVAGADVLLTQSRSYGGGRGGVMIAIAGALAGRPEAEKTAGDGSFFFRGLAPGDYQVQVRRSGYATETVAPVKLVRGEAAPPLEIALTPGATLSGIVRYGDGTPLAGRTVTVRPSAGQAGGPPSLSAGPPTGPDGLFVLEGLRPGDRYDVVLFEPPAPPRVVRSGVQAPADGIDVVVPTPGRITGNALVAGGDKPLTDFQVWYDTDRSTGAGGAGQVFRVIGRGAAGRAGGTGAGEKVVVHSEDGSFVLENVPPGTWEVNVEAQGYQPARVGGVTVAEKTSLGGVVVKVAPGVPLTGKVVDSGSGRGVPNVQISLNPAGAPGGAMRAAGLPTDDSSGPTTDADGAFQSDGVAPGRYTVLARHPDYADGTEAVDVKETGAAVKISLTPGSHISGLVADAANQPLAGAQVSLVAASDGGPMGRGGLASEGTTTDQSGSFRFDHLAAGRYTLTASLRNASSSQKQVILLDGQSQDAVVISLAAGTTVNGVITGLPDAQRGNVLVSASGSDGFGNSVRSAANGTFQVSGVPAGILMLRATAGDLLSGSRTKSVEVQVPAGGQPVVDAEIAFDPTGAVLSGAVTRGGQPVGGGMVMANARGGAGSSYSGSTDDSGRYRIEGVQNGTYGVTFRDLSSGGAGVTKTVTVASDVTVDFDIPQGRITGVVVESGSAVPLGDAMVTAAASAGGTGAAAPGGGPGGGMNRGASTDSNGTFAFETLDPATFTVTARRSGYVFDPKTVTVTGSETQEVTLEGKRSEGIGVQARDGILGVPLRSLLARVRNASGTAFAGNVTLDGSGRGEIPSVPPGVYTVLLDASGYAPAVLSSVAVPSPTLAVALTPGGNVEIHAGAKTLAAGQALATLLTSGGVPYPFTLFGQDGRVALNFPVRVIQNVAPGSYSLALDSGGSQTFTVQEGGTAVVALP